MRFEIYCDDEFNPCMENNDWNPWMRDSLVEYIGDNHSIVLEAPNYDEVQTYHPMEAFIRGDSLPKANIKRIKG